MTENQSATILIWIDYCLIFPARVRGLNSFWSYNTANGILFDSEQLFVQNKPFKETSH